MKRIAHFLIKGVLAAIALALLPACETVSHVTEAAATAAAEAGVIREHERDAVIRSSRAVGQAAEDITPEQEYYIGRAVAATLLAQYAPLDEPVLNHYLNVLGQTLARFSDKPETFGGYRFMALDTDEINAFAAPGGLILVSRGLIACCRNEDELAAVLAHEIGHVQHGDGLRAISRSRLVTAFTIIASETAKGLAGSEVAELVGAFEGSIGDITQTLVVNGYSRAQEYRADAAAIEILRRAGYDPNALVVMLEEMQKRTKPGGPGFASTHPAPSARIQEARKRLGQAFPRAAPPPERQQRFEQAIAAIR